MSIAEFRDIIIIIWGILGIIFLIAIAILSFFLYSKVSIILNDVKNITEKAKTISSYASREVIQPLIGLSVLVNSVTEAARDISRMFSSKGRKNNA